MFVPVLELDIVVACHILPIHPSIRPSIQIQDNDCVFVLRQIGEKKGEKVSERKPAQSIFSPIQCVLGSIASL